LDKWTKMMTNMFQKNFENKAHQSAFENKLSKCKFQDAVSAKQSGHSSSISRGRISRKGFVLLQRVPPT
jgi:hypothetical protein